MTKVEKIILVTATHIPTHKYFVDLAKKIADALKVPLEIREEDYVFVNEYGEKDEFGMAWLPQMFAIVNGVPKLLISRLPIDERTLNIDLNKALEHTISVLKDAGVSIQI